jgi:ubiquinone/menaquinone biosynthesis C-methylase UbiE
MNPKELVRTGYDRVAEAYTQRYELLSGARYRDWLAEITPTLPKGSRILDLGCGTGIPVAQQLAQDFQVAGVDISPVQIARAQREVPQAEFRCTDMTTVSFPAQSFQAVIALYSIIHVPLEEQPRLFSNIARWLVPGGFLLAVVGHTVWTGVEENWLDVRGATMYWSHTDAQTYKRWLTGLGFVILRERFIPEGAGGHTMFLAQWRNAS